jgi:hypothetical protein
MNELSDKRELSARTMIMAQAVEGFCTEDSALRKTEATDSFQGLLPSADRSDSRPKRDQE